VNCRRQQNVRGEETNGKRVHANNQHTEQENKGREEVKILFYEGFPT
jgi:hypothetical protein